MQVLLHIDTIAGSKALFVSHIWMFSLTHAQFVFSNVPNFHCNLGMLITPPPLTSALDAWFSAAKVADTAALPAGLTSSTGADQKLG